MASRVIISTPNSGEGGLWRQGLASMFNPPPDGNLMTRRPVKLLSAVAAFSVLGATALFLPGPSVLHGPARLLYAFHQLGAMLGLNVVLPLAILWTLFELWRFWRKSRQELNRTPIVLVLIALILVASFFLSEPARAMARQRAFQRAEALNAAIEESRQAFGRYPDSLDGVKPRLPNGLPTPGSIGSPAFRYELSPAASRQSWRG